MIGLRSIAIASALVAASLAVPFDASHAQNDAQRLDTNGEILALETNKGVLLRLDRPASDIFIANPEIADVQVKSPRLIYVFGVAPGETTLYALGADEQPIYSASLQVTTNLTRLDELYEQLLPDSSVQIRMVNGTGLLEGVAPTAASAEAAERYARTFLKMDVVNHINVVQPTQVNLRVKFAEVGRSTLKQLGVNWESLFDIGDGTIGLLTGRNVVETIADPITGLPTNVFLGDDTADSILGSVSTGNIQLNAVLDALETEGLISVLAEPNLTAVTGQTATFLAGGEFPVPIPDEDGIAIEFREFGVRLAFTPFVESSDRITLRVAPEVSELTNTGAINISGIAVPALSTRRVETTVELGSGQSFAVAGLMQSNLNQDVRKFPGLGDIPILGALFRSDAFRQRETELVVIVTPYLVKPTDARNLALPMDGEKIPNDVERYLHNEMISYAPRTLDAPGAGRSGPSLVGRAGFRLK
ncbi:fimbriae assembly protein [Iodidimonas gelatinilytica]|uniref:Fimbriae assembly protein n=2 Tax=Iodidimonas gelatinilytica TaxID=1236966 RepID=A0A5A7MV97_9PROT|nr:type II and III secretion system protein family protein [Iodidimonas gelatinilytica]GEQ99920.1 fimbriae assembly protein [Iodidimonas gelatinilytica]